MLKLTPRNLGALILIGALTLWMLSGLFSSKKIDSLESEHGTKSNFYDSKESKAVLHSSILEVQGITLSDEAVTIASQYSGIIKEIHAPQGTFVKKGDPIMEIQHSDISAKLEHAKAALESSKIGYEAAKNLFDKDLISKLEYNTASAEYKRAMAEYKAAQSQEEKAIVTSPFDGYVDKLSVQKGDTVNLMSNAHNLGTIINANSLKAQVYLSPNERQMISKDTVTEIVGTFGKQEEKLSGHIINISKAADPTNSAFLTEIKIQIPMDTNQTASGHFMSGQDVKVFFKTLEILCHYLPQSSLSLDEEGNLVLKVINPENNTVKSIVIHLNSHSKDNVARVVDQDDNGLWIAGLPRELNVIMNGHSYLKDGDKLSS